MEKLDILNREEFVDQLINLTENISFNKATTSFAINGAWGCGKSFVLDMFEEKLSRYQSEETEKEKYFIIRYNCWKYDYYEEPLIAIVSTIIEVIEEKTKLFPDTQDNREMLGMLKATGVSLLTMLNTAVKNKTGVDFKEAYDTVSKGAKDAAEKYAKDHKAKDAIMAIYGELQKRRKHSDNTDLMVQIKYNEKAYDRLAITIPKGRKDGVEAFAKEKGESINGLVNCLLREAMGMSEEDWKKTIEEED